MDVEDDERSETLSQVSSNASTEPLSPEALERKRAYQASQLSMSDADAAKPKPTRGGSLTSDLSNLSDDEQQSDPDTAAPQTGSPPQSVDASQPPEADALSTAATLLQAQPASPSAHDSHPSPENKNSLSTQPIDEAPHPQEAAFSLAPAPAPPTVPEPHSSADLHADNLFTSPKEGSQSSQKRKRARDDLAVDSDGDQPSPAEAESEFPIDESESKRQRTSELTEAQAAAATLNGFPQSGLQVPTPESPSRSTSPALSQQAEDASTADQLSNAQPDAQQPQHSGSEAGSDDGQELDEEDYDAEPADNTEGPQEDLEAAQAEQSSADEGAGDERSEGEEEEEPEEPDGKCCRRSISIWMSIDVSMIQCNRCRPEQNEGHRGFVQNRSRIRQVARRSLPRAHGRGQSRKAAGARRDPPRHGAPQRIHHLETRHSPRHCLSVARPPQPGV